MPKWNLPPISHLLLSSLLPSTKCSSSPHARTRLAGDTAAHVPPLPQLPRDNPCSGVFVVLTLWASDPQRRTLCADTGVFWLHLSMSLSMKRGGGCRKRGGGGGKDDYEDTQDKGLLLLWWQRIIGVEFPWRNCFKSKVGLVPPTLKPACPLTSSSIFPVSSFGKLLVKPVSDICSGHSLQSQTLGLSLTSA